MSTNRGPQWTKPFHGVQHLGTYGTQSYWCTVDDYRTFAVLYRNTPGCGFHAMESTHSTAEDARAIGADWLASVTSEAGIAR